jgi:predicted alpha/beta-hydrolase family hydrolase
MQTAYEQRIKSLSLFETIQDQYGITFCTMMLGYDTFRLNDIQKAKTYFAKALTLAKDLSATTLILDVFVGYAMIAQREQNDLKALSLLEYVIHHPACTGEMRARAATLQEEISPYTQGKARTFSTLEDVVMYLQ